MFRNAYTPVITRIQAIRGDVDHAYAQGVPIAGPIRAALRAARRIFERWDSAQDAVDNIGQLVAMTYTTTDLTDEAKQRRAGEIVAGARAQVEADLEAAGNALNTAVARLRQGLVPPRPAPADAAQESALAGLKTDLRMLLDSVEPQEACARLAEQLAHYVSTGNALGVWLLASSDWPALYLRSRGAGHDVARYDLQEVPSVLRPAETPEQRQARSWLNLLDRTDGVRGALTMMRAALAQAFEDAADPSPNPALFRDHARV